MGEASACVANSIGSASISCNLGKKKPLVTSQLLQSPGSCQHRGTTYPVEAESPKFLRQEERAGLVKPTGSTGKCVCECFML